MSLTPNDPLLMNDLAKRIGAGDAAAESELIAHFRGGVFAMVYARTRDVEAARDLAQDVMLAVLCALREGRVRSGESLVGFVRSTTLNLVGKYIHGLVQERRLNLIPTQGYTADPEEALEHFEKVELVRREMKRLDATDRTILDLTLGDGLNPAEISEQLQIKAAVVRERKSRAIRRISERVKRLLRKHRAKY